jgi:flagellar basal body-associated protein FliL
MVGMVLLTIVVVAAWFWFVKNQKSDSDNAKSRVAIKIDRNGKHRYEVIPNSGNSNLKFWVRVIIAIIALLFLWLPFKLLFQPQY